MHTIIIFITLAIFTPYCLASCLDEEMNQNSESCYKTLKPILEYFSNVEKHEQCEADHLHNVVGKLEKIEAKLANASLELQLALLKKVETHLDTQSKSNEQAIQLLQDFKNKVEKLESQVASQQERHSLGESVCKESERKLEEQLHLVETYKADRVKNFQKILLKYYYIEPKEELSWEAASNRCRQMGSHLVNLKNEEEYTAVGNELTPGRIYWIGVNDRDTEGKYVTQTGDNASFLQWRQQPDNYLNEDCIELVTHKGMNDNDCTTKYHFICEISAELK